MSGFDYIVFLVVGLAAIAGFFRGFVQEVLALATWCLMLLAVHYGHAPLTELLTPYVQNETGAGVLAFGVLLLLRYFLMNVVVKQMGQASRGSVLGPIDRVLGFGFGAVKGFVIMVLAFSLLVFSYDLVWGAKGRPLWIKQGRTYPLLNAASNELMTLVAQRRSAAARSGQTGSDGDAAAGDGTIQPNPMPTHHARRHRPVRSDDE